MCIRDSHKRALCDDDMKKVFAKLSRTSGVPFAVCQAQELFILMFSLRGMPFVDLAYLRKSDLRDNVITYRRRKTGRPLSVTLTPEAMILVKKYMNRDPSSPYLFPLLKSREGTKEAVSYTHLDVYKRQMFLLQKYMNWEEQSPYLFPILHSDEEMCIRDSLSVVLCNRVRPHSRYLYFLC